MTIELTQPQAELGQAPADGQGQLQGHRHRRRRRKNKSSQVSAAQVQQPQSKVESQPPAEPQAPSQPQPQPAKRKMAPPRQGGRQNQNQGRKKKFFQKRAAPAAQPGNNISASPQGKRKSRQKSTREFVGPMDHNYGNRAVNGNVADGPSSTIQASNYGSNGGYYQDDSQPLPTVSVREDAPTRIFCFIEDLFFLAKIQETARKLGVKVEFVKNDKETVTRLTSGSEAERPTLLLFDLNNLNAKPMTLIPKLRAKLKKATSIIGFLSRLQGDLKMKALEAGCDTVMPRSAFSQSLPTLLRRYGMEEEEEDMSQPEEEYQIPQPV